MRTPKKYSTRFSLCSLTVLALCMSVCSQIKLSGEQWGTYAAGQYLATGDVTVPAGKTMVIGPGTVLRFNRYCGLIVRGTLVAESDLHKGIHFAAADDKTPQDDEWAAPQAPQWNGIEVAPGGSIRFENARILNSVQGLKASPSSASVILTQVMFANNEQDFSIGDSTVYVDPGRPLTFTRVMHGQKPSPAAQKEAAAVADSGARAEKSAAPRERKPREPWKLPVRLSLGGLALAGGALGIVCHIKAEEYADQYPTAGPDATEIRNKANTLYTLRNVCFGAGAAAAAGLTITFFF